MSFVTDMLENPSHEAIVRAIIDLGHNLGLRVVAEGIETRDVFRALHEAGCDVAQGYLLSRPMPAGDLPRFLAAVADISLARAISEREPAARRIGRIWMGCARSPCIWWCCSTRGVSPSRVATSASTCSSSCRVFSSRSCCCGRRSGRRNCVRPLLLAPIPPPVAGCVRDADRDGDRVHGDRVAGGSLGCGWVVQSGVLVFDELVLHPPVEQLLRGDNRDEPALALLVVGGGGAVLSGVAVGVGWCPRAHPSSGSRGPTARGRDRGRDRSDRVDGLGSLAANGRSEPRLLRHRRARLRTPCRRIARAGSNGRRYRDAIP